MKEPTMSQFATELDCLRARVKYFQHRAEAAEAKLRESEIQEPVARVKDYGLRLATLINMEGWPRVSQGQLLYAKPFPAPKQEEK